MSNELPVIEVLLWDRRVGALSWNPDMGYGEFQFDKNFRKYGWDLSPIKIPVSTTMNVVSFPTHRTSNSFHGLPGFIADSLPDKFGNQLIVEWFSQRGKTEEMITPLDKLCYLGKRGMGALEFNPPEHIPGLDTSNEIYIKELLEISNALYNERSQFQELIRQNDRTVLEILKVGTSAGGAKPKAIIAYNDKTGEVRSGQVPAPDGFGYWLLKFDGGRYSEHNEISDNPKGIGNIEYAYHKMAVECGIIMSECRLLPEDDSNHFMTKRFDRTLTGEKIHMVTAAGIAHLDRDLRHSYEEIFGILRSLNMNGKDFDQLYRRMVFNVMARNHDDHTKNFSFLMDKNGVWSFAPAYDLCYSYKPGGRWTREHQLSLNGKTSEHTGKDLIAVAENMGIRNGKHIIEEIREVVAHWREFAAEAGVRESHSKLIESNLLYNME